MNLPDHLSPDLQALVSRRKENNALLLQYKDLSRRLQGMIKAHEAQGDKKQRMHVDYDLGAGFTVEAVVPDSSKINMSLGTSEHIVAELSLEEALEFAGKRIDLCHRTEEALARQEADLRKDLETITDAFRKAMKKMQIPQKS